MALSHTVLQELQNLQLYYKSLYFLRWFIPSSIKTQLRTLETLNMDAGNEHQIKRILGLLCGSFFRPNWYARIILYWFSGLSRFARGELMQQARKLESDDLFSQDNLAFISGYDPLIMGVEGLQLLKATGVNNPNEKYERVAQMIEVKQLGLASTVSAAFYKAIAEQAVVRNYAAAIKVMNTNVKCNPYIRTLVSACNYMDYARSIVIFAQEKLLPEEENKVGASRKQHDNAQTQFKQTIVRELETQPFPLALASAVLELKNNDQLESCMFEQVKNSAVPVDLARLIKFFAGHLDQQILGRLEQHRKNLAIIARSPNIRLETEKKLDLDYCQNLVNLLVGVGGVTQSALLIVMYDHCYAEMTLEQRPLFVQSLSEFGVTDALIGDCGQAYADFLMPHINNSDFFVYMAMCTVLAKQAELVTMDNREAIFSTILKCVRPKELLARLKRLHGELSIGFLQALVAQINPPPVKIKIHTPSASSDDTASVSSDSPVCGLRQRKPVNGKIGTPQSAYASSDADLEQSVDRKVIYASSDADLEGGGMVPEERNASPKAATEGNGLGSVLGSVVGGVGGFVWYLIWGAPAPAPDGSVLEQKAAKNK